MPQPKNWCVKDSEKVRTYLVGLQLAVLSIFDLDLGPDLANQPCRLSGSAGLVHRAHHPAWAYDPESGEAAKASRRSFQPAQAQFASMRRSA